LNISLPNNRRLNVYNCDEGGLGAEPGSVMDLLCATVIVGLHAVSRGALTIVGTARPLKTRPKLGLLIKHMSLEGRMGLTIRLKLWF
jgi:hypothetical protein